MLPARPIAAAADDAVSISGSSSTGSSSSGGEETWQDVEAEAEEDLAVASLVDDRVFPSVAAMLEHCRAEAGLDFGALRKRLCLDFEGSVRLVNFLRARAKAVEAAAAAAEGKKEGKVADWTVTKEDLKDDRWLVPVLEDDALIMGLGDLLGEEEEGDNADDEDEAEGAAAAVARACEDDTPAELRAKNKALLAEVRHLRRQFDDYRLAVAETLDARWEANDDASQRAAGAASQSSATTTTPPKDESEYYWNSYAGNEIHESMLKDTVRTDAYRDFVYAHKDLFAGKVVLDVGCGTGILSMFCARAGAARVIAVDRSAIIHKARENIHANGLHETITTLHGAVEELTLPVAQVDVIISEWMGYALLYEAMLPSVLLARDRWLKPGGLMVPSVATLYVAPWADPAFVADNFSFWHDVYGFDMAPMQTGIYEECREVVVRPETACGPACEFLRLDLHKVRAEDLSFSVPWRSRLARATDAAAAAALDGFLVWFDIFFTRSHADALAIADGVTAAEWAARDKDHNVAFTTGPHGKPTHWMQTVYVVNPKTAAKKNKSTPKDDAAAAAAAEPQQEQQEQQPPQEGADIAGTIAYSVLAGDKSARALSVDISWSVAGGPNSSQRWKVQ